VVETMIMMTGALRYSANPGAGGEWDVVDQDRNDETVARCSDAHGAKLIAALMNGDVSQLASASPEALALCHVAIGRALRVRMSYGRPAVAGEAFAQF